jgi:hypothetical protein
LKDLGFTGVNPWDRTRAAKLADGTWRYQYEDVTTATGISAADLKGVRSWIDAPYHRLPLLDANTHHIGCAVDQQGSYTAQVLEMAATWKDTTRRITLYPAPGQQAVPTAFNRCREHPTPLAAATTYNVRISGYVQTAKGGKWVQFKTRVWSFTTA